VPGRRFPASFGRLRWRTWNARLAATTGTAWLDDCVPNCAQGHFHSYRAAIRADRVRDGHFTHLRIAYRYRGKQVVDQRVLVHSGRAYTWG